MNGGFRIGRAFGIDVHIDWSWLFIFSLITWNLAMALSQTHSEWAMALRWGVAVLASLLFFFSVLAHELAHSLVARAQGIPVHSITLFLFGGVSNIQREPESPRSEFLVAVVGPLTSLVIGAILLWAGGLGAWSLAAATPAQVIARLSPLTLVMLWLGSVNVSLGLFNLVPGFPLDGGRVLRSILWGASGSLRRATRWASYVGQGIAWLFILSGIVMALGARVPFFGGGLSSGLWLAFIGWFLNNAAAQSYRQVVIRDVLAGVPVSRLMRRDPPVCSPACTVSALVHNHVMGSDDQAFPVMNGQRLLGLVTLDDVRRVPREHWDDTRVSDIMTPADRLIVVRPNEEAAEALSKLAQYNVRQLPVMEGDALLGLFRRQDIVRWLQFQSSR